MNKEQQYQSNKNAKVGETIVCPMCGKEFVKKQYSQAFCCGTCKDAYWNESNGSRRKQKISDFDKGWWNCFQSFVGELIGENDSAYRVCIDVLRGAGIKPEEIDAFEAYKAENGDYYPTLLRDMLAEYREKYC